MIFQSKLNETILNWSYKGQQYTSQTTDNYSYNIVQKQTVFIYKVIFEMHQKILILF